MSEFLFFGPNRRFCYDLSCCAFSPEPEQTLSYTHTHTHWDKHTSSNVRQVQEYLTRFESIPDMLELDHLTVSGDVTFGKNVSLKVNMKFYWKKS